MSSAIDATDRLAYIGHATTLLRLDGTSVLTDPALRGWIGPLRRQGPVDAREARAADLVLISHLHRDHLDLPSLRMLPSRTPIVVPSGAARLASRVGAEEVLEMGPGETISVGSVRVTAVPAVHDWRRGPLGQRAQPLGFVIEGGGHRVYFAGDTDVFDDMADLRPLDLALLPVWGWGPTLGEGHLDPAGAARALMLLRPRVAIPVHWGTFFPVGLSRLRPDRLSDPPQEFRRLASEAPAEVDVRILEPGAATDL